MFPNIKPSGCEYAGHIDVILFIKLWLKISYEFKQLIKNFKILNEGLFKIK